MISVERPNLSALRGGIFLAAYCDSADTNKMLAIDVPLTIGPCHGIISFTKDGAKEANKLKDAKALNAAKPAI